MLIHPARPAASLPQSPSVSPPHLPYAYWPVCHGCLCVRLPDVCLHTLHLLCCHTCWTADVYPSTCCLDGPLSCLSLCLHPLDLPCHLLPHLLGHLLPRWSPFLCQPLPTHHLDKDSFVCSFLPSERSLRFSATARHALRPFLSTNKEPSLGGGRLTLTSPTCLASPHLRGAAGSRVVPQGGVWGPVMLGHHLPSAQHASLRGSCFRPQAAVGAPPSPRGPT